MSCNKGLGFVGLNFFLCARVQLGFLNSEILKQTRPCFLSTCQCFYNTYPTVTHTLFLYSTLCAVKLFWQIFVWISLFLSHTSNTFTNIQIILSFSLSLSFSPLSYSLLFLSIHPISLFFVLTLSQIVEEECIL